VLPENHKMVEVFRDSGFEVRTRSAAGVIEVEFPTVLGAEAGARFDERERIAAVAAVRSFLAPASVAVVGASRRPLTVGRETLQNILAMGFAGPVYAVNSRAAAVDGLPAYRSIADVPAPVDLAVIAVPAASVAGVARECAAKGVRALVVLSAGFAESGPAGSPASATCSLCAARPECDSSGLCAVGPTARRRGVPLPERRARPRHDRSRGRARTRAFVIRLERQQGRHLRQRPARVLGAGRGNETHRAVPRVVWEPAGSSDGSPSE
jgi:predicted CoA-binding protein